MTARKTATCVLLGASVLMLACSREVGTGKSEQKTGASTSAPVAPVAPGAPADGADQNPAGNAQGPQKWALLVGINNYKYPDRVSSLAGSINDVEDMQALLIGKFEFPPQNVLVLKDAQATHEGIIRAIQSHLIAKVQKDDIVVFHYSGHGSQMKDVTGTKISGLDETIVPFDSRDPGGQVFDINGAELHGLLLQLAAKTKNITFILDSCHSGTLVKGARVRRVPDDVRTPPAQLPSYAVVTRELGHIDANSPVRYAFIGAATSHESAFEHFADGKEHGALTYFLTRELRTSKAGVTYRDVMDNVMGNVTANYPAQHPQLEGAGIDQFVFDDAESLAQSYIPVSPVDAAAVSLGAGQVQGLTADSIFDVYKPGTRKFVPPEKPIARIRVTSVEPFTAEGKLISGTTIPKFSRAIESEHHYGSRKLRVYFDGLGASTALQSIKSALEMFSNLEIVDDQASCHVQIRETGGRVLTLAADSTTLSTPVPTTAPDMVDRLVRQIKGWAKWFNVLSIANPNSDVTVEFSTTSGSRDVMEHVGKPDVGVFEGETITATIKNLSGRAIYVSLVDLSSNGEINVVYPTIHGAAEVLEPGLSHNEPLSTSVPKGRSIVTDVLKVFASFKPIDLTPLTEGAIKAPPAQTDPLQDLLLEAGGISRNVTAAGAKPLTLGGWMTAQRVLVVRRRN